MNRKPLIIICLAVALSFCFSDDRAPAKTQPIPVFGFHDLVDRTDPTEKPPQRRSFDTDYYLDDFEKFLDHLLSHEYWFLSATEYDRHFIRRQPIPSEKLSLKPILLSFDDGYAGVYDHLLPLLRRKYRETGIKVRVVLFVHSGGIGQNWLDLRYLTCSQIREGQREGYFDLQSHGVSHRDLTSLDEQALHHELQISQEHLRDCLAGLDNAQETAHYIAYPYGANDLRVQKAAAEYYRAGFAYQNSLTAEPYASRYTLGRWQVSPKLSPEDLIQKASP